MWSLTQFVDFMVSRPLLLHCIRASAVAWVWERSFSRFYPCRHPMLLISSHAIYSLLCSEFSRFFLGLLTILFVCWVNSTNEREIWMQDEYNILIFILRCHSILHTMWEKSFHSSVWAFWIFYCKISELNRVSQKPKTSNCDWISFKIRKNNSLDCHVRFDCVCERKIKFSHRSHMNE